MKFTPRTFRIFTTLVAILFIAVPTLVFAAPDDNGSWVGTTLAGFGASIFGLVGVLFDKALSFLVFEIGTHMQGFIGVNVELVWSIVRDLCNLIFIFMFLFLGIRLILTVESVDNAQKIIARVIIAALLINFSLFVSKAIIDVSNVATVAVYNMFVSQSTLVGPLPDNAYPVSVGTQIAGQLGVQTWFSGATTQTTANVANKGFGIGLIMMFFFLLAAVTFLVATIMLIKRYIVLLLGMMFSPLVLLFSIIPKGIPFTGSFSKKADEGFHMFLQSAFFPAVFLFIIYIALLILKSYGTIPNFNGMLADDASKSSLPDIIVYCIGIGFLFLAMKSATMVSESMASGAMDMSRKLAGAATFGAAAFAGRKVIGATAERMSKSATAEKVRDVAARGGFMGLAARGALGTLKAAKEGSYEARATGVYKDYVAGSELGKAMGIKADAGYGVKGGGYRARQDAAEKEVLEQEKKRIELLEPVANIKALNDERDEAKEASEKADKEFEDKARELKEAEQAQKHDKSQEAADRVNTAYNEWKEAKKKRDEAKGAVKKHEKAIQEERVRRVVGSADYRESSKKEAELQKEEDRLTAERDTLQQALENATDPNVSEALAQQVKEAEAALLRVQFDRSGAAVSKAKAEQGYANVLQNRGTLSSWVRGRTQETQQAAGKKLREAYKKGVPKDDKKDDKKEEKKEEKKEDKH